MSAMLKPRSLIGTHDVLLITLDALRYDVACEAMDAGLTPGFQKLIPNSTWELRHTPGSFTYSAHQAFFAGFLPTPAEPGLHNRLFACRFSGSATTGDDTLIFDTPDVVSGFKAQGYRTVCIGGVGFFNKQNQLGNVLPSYFSESYWNESFGVTDPKSTENQIAFADDLIQKLPKDERLFLFLNVSALHQPNCIFASDADEDSKETQIAAMAYVDRHVPRLVEVMRQRAPVLTLICSDHGTAYGEDGYTGHRISHETVWNVPYAEFIMPRLMRAEK